MVDAGRALSLARLGVATMAARRTRCLRHQSFGCVDVDAAGGAGELIDSWFAGERRLVDECTLVPMSSQRGGEGGAEAVGAEAEDERACWLIAPIFDGATRESSYVVLDGRDLARGPVCEWAVGTFIPWGLHGSWRGASGRRTTTSKWGSIQTPSKMVKNSGFP